MVWKMLSSRCPLTIFADGVLAYDLNGFLVEDPDRVIGPHTLDHMGQFEPDEIHVRNHLYRKDYEILRSEETYEGVLWS